VEQHGFALQSRSEIYCLLISRDGRCNSYPILLGLGLVSALALVSGGRVWVVLLEEVQVAVWVAVAVAGWAVVLAHGTPGRTPQMNYNQYYCSPRHTEICLSPACIRRCQTGKVSVVACRVSVVYVLVRALV
jgi:hypothetical protein